MYNNSMILPNIKNNKFTPQPLSEICAERKTLLDRIEKAAEKRLVFICAPAGSGKTVSALLYLNRQSRKTAWIGLDALDDSAAVFYRMFCTGILSTQPDNSRMIEVLNDPAFDLTPIEHTVNFLAAYPTDECEYALALDDFHVIKNNEILKSLPLMLQRMPHSFVTLILTRNDAPRENFSEILESGKADLIGAEDLRFSKAEIKEYFTALGLDKKQAETVFNYTGGWAIGVNAISQLAKSSVPVPKGFGGQVLSNYITKLIWNEWSEDLRAFMLASAVTDEMPVALCEEITGRADAGKLLETLREQNAFVTFVEDGVYRYHHLFLDFLRSLPEYENADNKKACLTAAKFYRERGEILVARLYAYKSGDIDAMLNALYEFQENRGHSFDEYLSQSREMFRPGEIDALCERCPPFNILFTWIAFLSGDAKNYEKYMDGLLRNLPAVLTDYRQFGEVTFSMIAVDYRATFAKQIKQAALMPEVKIEGDSMRAASISLQMPFLHRSSRDYYELADNKLSAKLKKTFGKLLKDHYELVMQTIGSGIALEQNRVSEALNFAKAAVSLLTENTVKEIRFAVYNHLAAVYLAMGKEQELITQLEKTAAFVISEAQFLYPNFLAFSARVKLWNGDVKAAREWLDNYFVNESGMLYLYRIYQYFTTVRAYAVLGEYEKAKALAERLCRLGKDFNRPQDAAEAGVLISAVMWAQNKKEDSQKILEEVLAETQPHGFVRIIADEGAAVLRILKKTSGHTEHADYKGGLDPVYVNTVYLAAYAVSKQRGGIISANNGKPVKLSRQQRAVVELLAQGYKRDGIAEKTGLMISTVKTHIKIAYEKLGVENAADAVMRARELGILE